MLRLVRIVGKLDGGPSELLGRDVHGGEGRRHVARPRDVVVAHDRHTVSGTRTPARSACNTPYAQGSTAEPNQTFQADNLVVVNANGGEVDKATKLQDWVSVKFQALSQYTAFPRVRGCGRGRHGVLARCDGRPVARAVRPVPAPTRPAPCSPPGTTRAWPLQKAGHGCLERTPGGEWYLATWPSDRTRHVAGACWAARPPCSA
jgi:hypothetical protein